MQYLKLLKVPHVAAKSPELAEHEKRQVYGEIYALLSYLLNCGGALDVILNSSEADGGRAAEFVYAMPDDVPDLGAFLSTFRYLNFEVRRAPPRTAGRFAEPMLRRIVMSPAGNMDRLQEGSGFRLPHVGKNNPDYLYYVPIPQPLKLLTDDYRWRNTLAALQSTSGTIRCRVRKATPKAEELRFVAQCLNLYLSTYMLRLSPQQLQENVQAYQSILSEDRIFSVTIHADGDAREALRYALMRDTDLEALTTHEVSRQDPRLEEADDEVVAIVRRLQTFWSLEELVQLLSPPVTFQDAVAGLEHVTPSPFAQPYLRDDGGSAEAVRVGTSVRGQELFIRHRQLTEHVFVTGSTGAGKSHTVRHILRQLSEQGVPFLVIDPVKRDYEPLMKLLGKERRIITPRNPQHRFNPLIPPAHINVYDHAAIIARMLALFYPTTPAVYEILLSMLRETYLGTVARASGGPAAPPVEVLWRTFGRDLRSNRELIPSFRQFMETGTKWLEKFGSKEISNRWLAEFLDHFQRRWKLLENSFFYYLFTPQGNPHQDAYYLFENDWLVELYSFLDPTENKALFALLVALLCEKRMSDGLNPARPRDRLLHVTVIEEAHRVMPLRTKGWGEDVVNSPAEEAANLLGQMLAEIRYLGEGLIIAEQSPSKIIPDVLINTSTKIIHRILYGADKEFLGSSLGLSERESDYLSRLNRGEALVFSTDVSQPAQIIVPPPPAREVGAGEKAREDSGGREAERP